MRKFVFLIALLAALSLACNFNFSTANVEEAKLAKDEAGTKQTIIFDQADEFFLVGQLANAPDDTKLRAVWTAVEADGVDPNYQLDEKEVTGGGDFYFSLSNEQLWPTGKYKVDLYLNEELERTLEFTVEGEVVAEAPSPTAEPTSTPEPTPEPTEPLAEPTEPPADDSPLSQTDDEGSDSDTTAIEATEEAEYEPLPFRADPYEHPSGAFSFIVPEDWELVEETDTSATFGDDNSVVGAVFVDIGGVLSVAEFNDFVENFLMGYVGEETEYEVIEQEPQPDDSLYIAISYTDGETPSDADFFFEQRDTIMFVLLFDTFTYDEIRPTWDEIIDSYAVDAEAALGAAPATVEPVAPAPPTAAPEPVEPAGPVAPAGKGLLIYNNKTDVDFTIDVIGPTNTSQTIPPGQTREFVLDPGKYAINAHSAGGKYYVPSYEFEIAAGQVLYDGVQ
jgi:hypothetical protein